MTTTVRSFEVGAPAVFAVLVDPDTYPRWLTGAKKIRSVDADWPAPGSSFRHVVGFGPLEIPDSTTSKGAVANESLTMIVRARPLIEAEVRFELEPRPDGCILTMHETPIGAFKVIAPLVGPLVRIRNERSMDRLHAVVMRR